MWIDKKMYWAWNGEGSYTNPPTVKRLTYETIKHGDIEMNICNGVYDNDVFTPLNRNEIDWHKRIQ